MYMKRFVIGAALALTAAALPSPVFAQQAGIKAGLNFATLTEADDDVFVQSSRRLGLIGGAWVRVVQRDAFSFQVEGLISEKGLKFEVQDDGVEFSGDIRIRYFEVPLLARVDLGAAGGSGRFYLLGGAAPAFRLGDGRVTFEAEGQEESRDIEDLTGEALKSFDLGLVAGAGVEFGRALVEGRYTHGRLVTGEGDDSPKNRVFSVLVGFRFR